MGGCVGLGKIIEGWGIVKIVTENRNKAVPLQKRNTMPLCLNCDTEFTPKNPKGKYCSDRCKVAYNRKKNASKIDHPVGVIYQPGVKMVEDSEIFPLLKSMMDKKSEEKLTAISGPIVTVQIQASEKKPFMNDAIKKKLGLP